ncbi:GSCOCG00011916001-RA-CDS [Cotesia congregata]|uniref:Defective in cullin neddylation protein n=1 Tax=Cotesia congregata TaxID=51543 RepID=A0A8J2HFP4_COTCN|nr:GSCOCG00011916001-RA-CDS [Cotesia congregata]CAG5093341.1 Similar to Dcun1d3: DCN1-like protein 3 (Mus musculus) [Cotesia congregata]
MGNCWSCFKAPLQSSITDTSNVPDIKEETMELKRLFPLNSCTKESLVSNETLSNSNKKSLVSTVSVPNNIGSDNCGSLPIQNNLRISRAFYARFPPLCRSMATNVNTFSDKHPKESQDEKLSMLFDQYKDPHEDIILADGIERLCNDLQLSPNDFKVLVLAWKLEAEQMCQFTRKEFVNGLKSMYVDSIQGIQTRLPEIVQELINNAEMFKDLYRFTFRFGLDVTSGQRILPVDMAIVLWKLVFSIREPSLLLRWLSFLECHHVRGIPRDTWNMFLNFVEVIGNDLGAYDDAEAWPSLFDDFVEYENDQVNQNITKDEFLKGSIHDNNN